MPEIWTAGGFAADFAATHKIMENRSFAFVLGAGASVSSGIPTGGQLAHRWVAELHGLLCQDGEALEDWATARNLDIEGFDLERAAEFYPEVFLRRFRGDREHGYAYLEHVMAPAEPSYGYSILAQILSETRHRVVVTTNFDNLVADALSIYGSSYPLIAGHESLTGFVSGRPRRPLVAKIHRDLFLEPKNDPEGVAALPEAWGLALARLFREHTPIFIGYGGNDGSLMGFLDGLRSSDLVGRLRWCFRESDGLPSNRVLDLVRRLEGVLIPIQGFDELMLLLGNELEFGLRDQYVRNKGVQRAEVLRVQFEALMTYVLGTKAGGAVGGSSEETKRAVNETLTRQASPMAYRVRISREADPRRKIRIAREAAEEFPNDSIALGTLATTLYRYASTSEEEQEARGVARRALSFGDLTSRSRAHLFFDVLRDPETADREYQEAMSEEPESADLLSDRAELWLFRGDARLARTYLAAASQALQRGPKRHAPHAALMISALEAITSLMLREPPEPALVMFREQLIDGVRATDYSVKALAEELHLHLEPEDAEFAAALLDCAVGASELSRLDDYTAWKGLPPSAPSAGE